MKPPRGQFGLVDPDVRHLAPPRPVAKDVGGRPEPKGKGKSKSKDKGKGKGKDDADGQRPGARPDRSRTPGPPGF